MRSVDAPYGVICRRGERNISKFKRAGAGGNNEESGGWIGRAICMGRGGGHLDKVNVKVAECPSSWLGEASCCTCPSLVWKGVNEDQEGQVLRRCAVVLQ